MNKNIIIVVMQKVIIINSLFLGFFWRNNTGVLPDSERPLILFLHGGPHASI